MNDFLSTLWATLLDLWKFLESWGLLAFLSFGNIVLWRRYRYWVPRYVHALALAALGVNLYINYLWTRADGEMTTRRWIVMAIFPLLVYFLFVGYGGVRAAAAQRGHPPTT